MDINISENIVTVMKEMLRRCDGLSTFVAVLMLIVIGSYRAGTNLYYHVENFHDWKIVYICFGFVPVTFLVYINMAISGKKDNRISRAINSAFVLLIPLIVVMNFS